MVIRDATVDDHAALCKIAKTSPYTGDFSNRLMFSSDAAYDKGWIRVAEIGHMRVGFYCVRQKSRGAKATALYFLTVLPDMRSKRVGQELMNDMKARSPSGLIELNVAKENTRALAFYERHAFKVVGESLSGAGWAMRWERDGKD